MNIIHFTIIALVLILLSVSSLLLFPYTKEFGPSKTNVTDENVFCIMITGKANRKSYAIKSVKNFWSQTYQQKHLIIINHGKDRILTDVEEKDPNVIEILVEKTNNMTLGDLRNIALELVAHNGFWTTWDDDDWRHHDYLSAMMSFASPTTVVAITARMEYNLNNNTAWIGEKPGGFVFFIAPKDLRVQYLKKDTMEDVNVIFDYRNLGYIIQPVNLPSYFYLRLIHENTSLYVDKFKSKLIKGTAYSERHLDNNEKRILNQVLSMYYNIIVQSVNDIK